MFFKRLHPGRYIVCKVEINECVQLQTTCTKETGNGSNMIKPDYDPNSTWRQPAQNQGKKLKIKNSFSKKENNKQQEWTFLDSCYWGLHT